MSLPESYKPLMPAVRDTLIRGGMTEAEANALFVGLITGANWVRQDLPLLSVFTESEAVNELAKDILAGMETFKPKPTPERRPS